MNLNRIVPDSPAYTYRLYLVSCLKRLEVTVYYQGEADLQRPILINYTLPRPIISGERLQQLDSLQVELAFLKGWWEPSKDRLDTVAHLQQNRVIPLFDVINMQKCLISIVSCLSIPHSSVCD